MSYSQREHEILSVLTHRPVEAGEVHWLKSQAIILCSVYFSLYAIMSGTPGLVDIGTIVFGICLLSTAVSCFVWINVLRSTNLLLRFKLSGSVLLRHGHTWLGMMARWAVISALPVSLVLINAEMWAFLVVYAGLYLISSIVTFIAFKIGECDMAMMVALYDEFTQQMEDCDEDFANDLR